MKGHQFPLSLFVVALLMIAFSPAGYSQSRPNWQNYAEEEIIAPDFTLQSLDGETYTLSDYRGQKVVVIETGSST